MVLVHWLESPELSTVPAPGGVRREPCRSYAIDLRRLQWEYTHRQERGRLLAVPRYDVVTLASVQRRAPVAQDYAADPDGTRGLFVLNSLVDWERAMGEMLCPAAAARAAGCCPGGNCRCDQCLVRVLLACSLCFATASWPPPQHLYRFLLLAAAYLLWWAKPLTSDTAAAAAGSAGAGSSPAGLGGAASAGGRRRVAPQAAGDGSSAARQAAAAARGSSGARQQAACRRSGAAHRQVAGGGSNAGRRLESFIHQVCAAAPP